MLSHYNWKQKMIKADGFDEAIIGVGHQKGSDKFIVYSFEKCIDILMERDGMNQDEAVDFMEHNVLE